MWTPVSFSNVHQRTLIHYTYTNTHTQSSMYFINRYVSMSILFSLFANYVTKCVMFYVILINCVPLIIVMITQSEDLEH